MSPRYLLCSGFGDVRPFFHWTLLLSFTSALVNTSDYEVLVTSTTNLRAVKILLFVLQFWQLLSIIDIAHHMVNNCLINLCHVILCCSVALEMSGHLFMKHFCSSLSRALVNTSADNGVLTTSSRVLRQTWEPGCLVTCWHTAKLSPILTTRLLLYSFWQRWLQLVCSLWIPTPTPPPVTLSC